MGITRCKTARNHEISLDIIGIRMEPRERARNPDGTGGEGARARAREEYLRNLCDFQHRRDV